MLKIKCKELLGTIKPKFGGRGTVVVDLTEIILGHPCQNFDITLDIF